MTSETALRRRGYLTIAVTLALAFSSGHLMQSLFGDRLVPPASPAALPAAPTVEAPLRPAPILPDRVFETRSPRSAGCAPSLQVDELPGTLLKVMLSAPCHRSVPLRLTFNGLVADLTTGPHGDWETRLPQIGTSSQIAFDFGDVRLSQSVASRNPAQLQHVILSWQGPQTFRVQAEMHGAAASPDAALSDTHLTRLGDGSGSGFEISSFPVGVGQNLGLVRLSVDATVTAGNCGKSVATTAYQSGFLSGLRRTEISYTMPDCASVGETVRLQNLFRDMRLAAR